MGTKEALVKFAKAVNSVMVYEFQPTCHTSVMSGHSFPPPNDQSDRSFPSQLQAESGFPGPSNAAQEALTSDDDVAYAEESLNVELLTENTEESDQRSGFSPKRYAVPTDPEEYHTALQEAIEADRRNAHLCGSEFELTFETHYVTSVRSKQPGERIFVTGDLDFLGAWNPAAGLEMEWSPGHVWRLTVTLAEGTLPDFKYKYVCVKSNRTRWEAGPDRQFSPALFTAVRGPKVIYHLRGKWQT